MQANAAHFRAVREKNVIPVEDAKGNVYPSIEQAATKVLNIDSGSLSKMLACKRTNYLNVKYA